MSNRAKNYETGYRMGINGVPFNPEFAKYTGYEDGWDAGNCDRPTLDEILPIDVAKERSTGCLN